MNTAYNDKSHFYGRIWILSALGLLLAVPAAICLYYNAWPEGTAVLKGLLGVAPIYWTVAAIEVFTYGPMLGTGGSYLAFVTGNITNIKAPAALSAMENADAKPERCFIGCPHLTYAQLQQWTAKFEGELKRQAKTRVGMNTIFTAAPDVVEEFKNNESLFSSKNKNSFFNADPKKNSFIENVGNGSFGY